MGVFRRQFKLAACAVLASACAAAAQPRDPGPDPDPETDVPELLRRLADPDTEDWERVEKRLRDAWSRSGSAALDLLQRRGERALLGGDAAAAFEHFSALTDHAPGFADGWHGRATALHALGHHGPALEDFGRALALNPDDFDAVAGLALLLQSIGMLEEALEAWRLAEDMHPHDPTTKEAIEALEDEVGDTET